MSQEKSQEEVEIRELWIKKICDNHKHTKFETKEIYDFIIVGAGTAGCVLARELIYCIPKISILVLEAGGPDAHSNGLISLPCTWPTAAFLVDDHNWGYVTEEQKMQSHINPTKEMIKKAKEYNNWAAQGPEYKIWDWDHCLEVFKAMENNSRKKSDKNFKKFHGFNGLLHVEDCHDGIQDIMSGVIDAAKNLDIPYNEDFNGERQNGVGTYQFTSKEGKRCSLVDSYLRDALKKVELHPGLESNDIGKVAAVDIRSYTHVLDIIWDKENKKENIAIGVRYFYNGIIREVFVAPKGEVILCGGVFNSPQILMISGVGPKENLEANNIKIRRELPVGRNLMDHPSCSISAKSTKGSIHHLSSGGEIVIIHKANVEGKIPCKENFFDENPDCQITATPFCSPSKYNNTDRINLLPALNVPSSVADDLYRMISSLKLCREIIKQPPLSTVYNVKEIGINDEFGKWCTNDIDMSDEDWEKYILNKSFSSSHACGTVKMAPESKGGVVNHRLQVHGTKNLRVVDASIFPYIPSGNTNAPTAMVAWKASRLIIEDYME
ncbi:7206_t:CDS:2 [Scutellospora calospora]|uniref:7206_t:CDS:1 n=1 Tax=Scutellospora calospora TaxID=85575 RepID=A0ACA9KKK0_9GLOM|nr:7206_t:CDS:2 [Scutellospora calospora]